MGKGEFIMFVQELWKEERFSLRQICKGVCGVATMMSWLDGSWKPDMLFQNSILERLGVNEEDFMYYLDYDAYERWKERQIILHCITFRELEKAMGLLNVYKKKHFKNGHLEEQFCLTMYAQIRFGQGAVKEELSKLYKEALEKTVLDSELGQIGALVLSVQELHLLLDTEHYRKEGERQERYQEVVEYIEKRQYHQAARGKIYPKAVYYLCRCVKEKNGFSNAQEAERLLQYCEQGIELLRDCERMYYLWELLDMSMGLVHKMAEEMESQGQQRKAQALKELHHEKEVWKHALENVYAEKGVPKETIEDCYLYVVKGVACLNDVIRVRRQMFGMEPKELCAGICDIRTLRRLEQRKSKVQWEIAKRLLERLGLPGEYTRIELVTGNIEVYRDMRKLREVVNLGKWQEANALLKKMGRMVSMEYPCNGQVVQMDELLIRWRRGEFDAKTYCIQMREVLERTLPYDAFLSEGEKYLTNEEQTCILNRMQGLDMYSEEFLTCMCRMEKYYQPYIEEGIWEGGWNMYEFVMSNVGSMWGNQGEYDLADLYSGRILEGCLRFRRMGLIHNSIYDRWWNYDQRKSNGISTAQVLDDEEELSKCILFSYLAKDQRRIKNYIKKLETVKDLG